MSEHVHQPFEQYLGQVRRQIAHLPAADQARILAELRAHLHDAAAEAGRTPEDLAIQQAVIAALGPSRRLGRSIARANRHPLTPQRLALILVNLARALVATLAALAALLFAFGSFHIVPPPRPDTAVEVTGRLRYISPPHPDYGDISVMLDGGRHYYINRANEIEYLNWQQMLAELRPGTTVQLTVVRNLSTRLTQGDNVPRYGPLAGLRTADEVYMDTAIAAASWTTSEYTMLQSALMAVVVVALCLSPELRRLARSRRSPAAR